ncbi:MAG: hypothetical protein ACE5H0_14900 [Bacteroidota bacterium]
MTDSSQVESGSDADIKATKMHTPELQSQLKLLRDQVDDLQIATSEGKKPWYRQATTLISLLALLLSGFAGYYSQKAQRAEEIRSKKEELRKTVAAVVELREDFQQRIARMTDLREQESAALLWNNKRLIHLEFAEFLATQIPNLVSSSEYLVLAYEREVDSNFTRAKRHYEMAVKAGSTALSKVNALRALGQIYFRQGPLQDFEKGREYFRKAAELLANPPDPYLVYSQGWTYQQWAFAELRNRNWDEGREKIERARAYYLGLPENYPRRQFILQVVDDAIRSIEEHQAQ